MSIFNGALTSTGYTRVPLADIKTALETVWQGAYCADIDVSAGSPDGQIIGGVAEMFSDLEAHAAYLHAALANPNGATGQQLTNIAAVNGLRRNGGTASIMPVAIQGTVGTVVPKTFTYQSVLPDGSKALWSDIYTESGGTMYDGATIPSGGTTANTFAICTVQGPTACPAGTTLNIITVTPGVTGLVASSDATKGYLVEGDPSMRIRRANSFTIRTQGMADGLDAALNNLTAHVAQAAVWENNTGAVANFPGGGSISKNSIRPVVVMKAGGSQASVAETIYAYKGTGCGNDGDTEIVVLDEEARPHTMRFDLAVPLIVYVRVYVTKRAGYTPSVPYQIASLVQEWGANIQNTPLGGDSAGEISATAILASFLGKVPGFDLKAVEGKSGVQLSTDGATWLDAGENLPITFKQYAQLLSENVVVFAYDT